jgi:hypothetical protein
VITWGRRLALGRGYTDSSRKRLALGKSYADSSRKKLVLWRSYIGSLQRRELNVEKMLKRFDKCAYCFIFLTVWLMVSTRQPCSSHLCISAFCWTKHARKFSIISSAILGKIC